MGHNQTAEKKGVYELLRANDWLIPKPSKRNFEDDQCDCDPSSGCSSGECYNRSMMIECNVKTCPCGKLCTNRRFQVSSYNPLVQPSRQRPRPLSHTARCCFPPNHTWAYLILALSILARLLGGRGVLQGRVFVMCLFCCCPPPVLSGLSSLSIAFVCGAMRATTLLCVLQTGGKPSHQTNVFHGMGSRYLCVVVRLQQRKGAKLEKFDAGPKGWGLRVKAGEDRLTECVSAQHTSPALPC
jgi:hypothetical protein